MQNWIKPFHDDDNHGYHYFSVEQITEDVKITQKIYDEALSLINDEKAYIVKAVFGYSKWIHNDNMIGNIFVNFRNNESIEVDFSKDKLLKCHCQSYSCIMKHNRASSGICIHEAAALILMQKYLLKNRPGDSTDYKASIFLDTFRNRHQTGNQRNNIVYILPRLNIVGDNLTMRLVITKENLGRTYIVRDIYDLFNKVLRKETYPLGKNNQIDFSVENFAEDNKEFAQMLCGLLNDKFRKTQDRWYSYREDDLRNHVNLYGDRLDRFFELFKDKEVEFDNKKIPKLIVKEFNPPVKLDIESLSDSAGNFEGISVSGRIPMGFYGNKYSYCIHKDCLCRIDSEYEKEIEPLMSLADGRDDKISFQIGRKNLSEFYYTILPTLRKVVKIKEKDSETIESYLPPEVSFRFYLDMVDGYPECRVGTWYGDTGVAIFDLLESSVLKEDFRDAQREGYVLDIVMDYFPNFRKGEERFLASQNEDEIYNILETAVPKLMALGDVVCTDRFQSIQNHRKLNISVGVSIDSDLLNLEITTDNLTQKELLDIIKSYRQNKKYHRLKSGEFVDIDDSIAELSAMLDTMHISPKEFVKGKMKLPAYRALYLDKMLEQSQEIYAKRDSHYKKLIKSFKTVTESDFEIPESLNGIMRSYQQFGHKWLRTISACGFGGILADDMGLGKTLQIISVISAEKTENNCDTALIVCPASLVFNWAAEFDKFAPHLNYCTIVGTLKEREKLIADYQNYDVLITSYDLIKRDAAHYEDCTFSCQVLDEAQYIKNHTTAAAKSVKLIKAKQRFALTGTPIENRLSELWSIFDYLMPGFLYGYETFKKEFETPIVKKSDEEATKRLRRMTSPFILRRLKKDVLRDLPDKLEENYIVRFDEEQQHIYDAKVLELRQILDSENDSDYQNNKLRILAHLTQIRQICCDPSLLFENYNGESAKKSACMEIVQRAIEGEHRVLIFSQFTSMLERLENMLYESNIQYYKITGETSKKKRLELVDSFNSENIPVFLISLKAGGTGLNLTGADVVIHYDPWWNVAAQNQATDRAHRIGQTKKVTVYKLIAKNTIEEKIQQMQIKKANLADSVLSGDFVNLSSLSKEELIEMLG